LIDDLAAAWRLQQNLSQLMKVALTEGADPEREPRALRSLMAKAAGVRDYRSLRAALTARRRAAHRAFRALTAEPPAAATAPPTPDSAASEP
jgi:glutamate-ammonia-ligase adenylyltransferase